MGSLTLAGVLRQSAKTYGTRPAFLTVEKSGVQTLTYSDLYTKVLSYAGNLVNAGLVRGEKLALMAENSVHWMCCDLACQVLGVVTVPIYPTLLAEQADHIVRDSGAKLLICGNDELLQRMKAVDAVPKLLVNSLDSPDQALTPEAADREIDAGDAALPFTIIYTSGTTGTPKGALLAHTAFTHICKVAADEIAISKDDVFMSFLPMSHVFERIGQYLSLYLGASCCVSKSLMALPNELKVIKPTLMFSVPRFLENMRNRVLEAVAKEKPIRQKLFALALKQGKAKFEGKFAPLVGLTDHLVAEKVRARVGGRMRYLISGGAALAPAVSDFFFSLGLEVLQGYGLTETSGGSCVNRPYRNNPRTVGEPLGMEIKIAEDGEILMRGPGIMIGYHNMPEETAKAIDPDGWFHTGDIGEMEGPALKITDRKKDILVLGNGKNVAPQPIENKLKISPYIAEAVVLGDAMDHCICLVVPAYEAVRHALSLADSVVLSTNDAAKNLIKQEVENLNKSLASFEAIKKHAILDEPFTVDNGELTPTLKVKRKVVTQHYKELIETLK